jgi:hypothetical protein
VKRRDFITLLGGVAAWPFAARAQQAERVRRIGLLMGTADDREGQARVTALKQGLQELGWTDGRNIQIETRFAGADGDRIRAHAAELVALAPDVIVAFGSLAFPSEVGIPPNAAQIVGFDTRHVFRGKASGGAARRPSCAGGVQPVSLSHGHETPASGSQGPRALDHRGCFTVSGGEHPPRNRQDGSPHRPRRRGSPR